MPMPSAREAAHEHHGLRNLPDSLQAGPTHRIHWLAATIALPRASLFASTYWSLRRGRWKRGAHEGLRSYSARFRKWLGQVGKKQSAEAPLQAARLTCLALARSFRRCAHFE